jgi:hypothetical protein
MPANLLAFIEMCERGKFYHAIGEPWGLDADVPAEKEEIKALVFKLIFYDPTLAKDPKWLEFKESFPDLAAFLEEIKAGNYAVSARASQRLESNLIINGVVRRLAEDHPAVPVATVHDAIYTTQPHHDLVQSLIEMEFGRLGLQPKFKKH